MQCMMLVVQDAAKKPFVGLVHQLIGAVRIVHTAPWPHYPNKNVFSDNRNLLYDKSASLRCDGRLFHSPGPAAANTVSPKVLYVRVTTHVRLVVVIYLSSV